jgi:hypothetical protein
LEALSMTKRRGRLNLTAEDRARMVKLRDNCAALGGSAAARRARSAPHVQLRW